MGSNDPPNKLEDGEADPPPSKIACFELNIKSNNKWVLPRPNRCMQIDLCRTLLLLRLLQDIF